MKKVGLFSLSIVLLAGASFAGYYFLITHGPLDERHTTCLAAVIPSVVLHHQHEEIVQLIQDLAQEAKESLAPEKIEPLRPIFSSRVDSELLKIAEAFQSSVDKKSKTEVDDVMVRTIQYFDADAPQYLATCLGLVNEALSKCGTLEAETEIQKTCLDPYSEKVNQLVKSQIASATK